VLDFLLDHGTCPVLEFLDSRAGPGPRAPNPDDDKSRYNHLSPAHCCLYHYVHSSRDSFQFYLKKRKKYSVVATEMPPRPGEQNVSFIRNKKLNFEYYLIDRASAEFWLVETRTM